jgi:hypothetical protein
MAAVFDLSQSSHGACSRGGLSAQVDASMARAGGAPAWRASNLE